MGTKLSKSNKGGKGEEFITNGKSLPENFAQTSTLPSSFRKKGQSVNRSEWTGSLPRNSGTSKGPPKPLDRSASFSKRFRKSCRNWAAQKGLVNGNIQDGKKIKPAEENEPSGEPDVMTEKFEGKPVEVQDVPEVVITEPEKEMDLAAIVATLVVEAHKKKMASRAQSRAQSREALLDCTSETNKDGRPMDESEKIHQETHETLVMTKVDTEVSKHESEIFDTEVSEIEKVSVNDLCDESTKEEVQSNKETDVGEFVEDEVKSMDVEETIAIESSLCTDMTEKSGEVEVNMEETSFTHEIQEFVDEQAMQDFFLVKSTEENVYLSKEKVSEGIVVRETVIEETQPLDEREAEESLVIENLNNEHLVDKSEPEMSLEEKDCDSVSEQNFQMPENTDDLAQNPEDKQQIFDEHKTAEANGMDNSEQDSGVERIADVESDEVNELNEEFVYEKPDDEYSDNKSVPEKTTGEESLFEYCDPNSEQKFDMNETTDDLEENVEDKHNSLDDNVTSEADSDFENSVLKTNDNVECESNKSEVEDDTISSLEQCSEPLTEDVVEEEVPGEEMAEQENDKDTEDFEEDKETSDIAAAGEIELSAVKVSDSNTDLEVFLPNSELDSDDTEGIMDEIINDIVETVTNESRNAASDESDCESTSPSNELGGASSSDEETAEPDEESDDVIEKHVSRDTVSVPSENESVAEKLER
eukprot:TRINITY_DN14752_c0_g1_i1.p1 TRINITY_DN14752_c0_g1~~TRINITY_DN14752_c0_g1_i1.p1  ORF type:complete len:715 (-),score=248.84 TRINITY_DN14752_c0_g1_i1:113-2218(-)